MSKKKQTGILWVPLQPFDLHLGFCPDKKSWDKCLKKYHVKGKGDRYPSQYGGCFSFFTDSKDIGHFGLITVNKLSKQKTRRQVDALLAHEISHAVDWVFECMNERFPSTEVRAYLMQHLFMVISKAYEDTVGYNEQRK